MYLLPPAVVAAMSERVVSPVIFVYLDWEGGEVFAHNHIGEILFDGKVWLGIGGLGKIGQVVNDNNIGAHSVSLALSPVDPLVLNEVVTKNNVGRTVDLYIGFLDENGQLIDAVQYFGGRISEISMSRYKDDTISLTAVSKTSDWAKSRPDRYTHGSFSNKPEGDDFFQYVDDMAQREIGLGSTKSSTPLVPRNKR